MDREAAVVAGIAGIVGIAIGALIVYLNAPGPKPVLAPTCPSILPAGGASNGYAFYATDDNGDYAFGVLHFYPNGYRHNAAVLIDQGNSPSTDPVTLFDVSVPGGCSPADGSRAATLTLTRDGAPAATLEFSQPASDPNAGFAVTFTALNGSGSSQNPTTGSALSALNGSGSAPTQMTGNAFLIDSQ
jgi:hypothetical protein